MKSMELDEILHSNAAYREFTKEPIPESVLYEIFDLARFSPSGGNRQGWHLVVVEDPELKTEIKRLYQLSWREYAAHVRQGLVPFAPTTNRSWVKPAVDLIAARNSEAPSEFVDTLDSVPVMLCLFVDLKQLAVLDNGLQRQSIVGGASIYPFAENLLLAARSFGYGGVLTTVLCRQEDEVMRLMRVPEDHALAGLIVLGRPKTVIRRLRRSPVEEFVTYDTFYGQQFTRPARDIHGSYPINE